MSESIYLMLLDLLPSKNIISERTPRKLPFKDTTNNSSARKVSNIGAKNEPIESKKIQLGQSKNSHPILIDDDFDFIDNFNFPSDRACYCCGNDKKGDYFSFTKKIQCYN